MKKSCRNTIVPLLFAAWAVLFSSAVVLSQSPVPSETPVDAPVDVRKPSITPVRGGYFLEWPTLVDVGSVRLKGPLTGKFEMQFDVRFDHIDNKPQSPRDPDILMPLADYWIVRGKPERAIPLYRRGLEEDPENLTFQNNLAMLLSSVQGDHDGALGMIDKVLETRLDNVTLLDTKGLILLNAGRPEEAIPVLERAVTLSCQAPLYVMHLAQALDMDGQETRAREWFDKARPLLEGARNNLSKDNREIFDNLKMKYNIGE